tara:strand:+ start:2679 stop:3443 length:765 start_codon:yes stop_codon:yes gene_type:complete
LKRYYKKTIIIAPHADDEIFTFPFIYSKDNIFDSIDLLLLENDKKRYSAAIQSAKINSFNIKCPKEYNLKGLYFHEKIELLVDNFSKLFNKYDLILAPLMEGGHQDHDSSCASLFLSKEIKTANAEIVLYSTYRNFDFFPYIYTCGISNKNFSKEIFSVKFSNQILILCLKTILFCYGSQYKTWILLLPAILYSYFTSNINKFVDGNNLQFQDIIKKIPNKPLYEIYRGLDKERWMNSLKHISNKIILKNNKKQ